MRTMHVVVGGLALAAAMGISKTVQANMLVNGDFEDCTGSPNSVTHYCTLPAAQALTTLPGGSSDLPGWTITGASIDVVPNTYWQAASGNNSIDLTGSPGNGAITQTVATTPGAFYILLFDFAVNPGPPPTTQRILDVSATSNGGATLADQQFSGIPGSNTITNMGYTSQEVDFFATDSLTTITFSSIGTDPYAGPVIDNLDLEPGSGSTPDAPEPATLSVLGLAGAGLLLRRRRK